MLHRRHFLKTAAAATLAAPRLARAADQRVLKFVPQADLAVLDPVWTTATVTRNHAFLVFDTLFGQDSSYGVVPQMAAGAVTENDGRMFITLKPLGQRTATADQVIARLDKAL